MFYPAKISSIERLTEDAVSLELVLNPLDVIHFPYQAGQYIVIRVPALNAAEHRSYSLSSAPYEKKLQIGVKKHPQGLVSSFLCDQAKVGDLIEIMAPQGSFILSQQSPLHSLVAFAAGSGITPVISIIKQLLKESSANISLFYGNKGADSIMFKSQLDALVANYPVRFEVNYIYSQQKTGLADLEGRIDSNKIHRWKEYLFSLNNTETYLLCGPGNMVETIQSTLISLNIDQSKIITEYFTAPTSPVVNPPEFKATTAPDGFHIVVKYEGKSHDLQSANNKTVVLDLGLKQGIDLPYSCKSGVCSTCQARLIKGEVKMDNNYVLSESELKQGFILTCQSHPVTSFVEVDYDMK
jgi:ring-1,2-phenylacetyl-CoA epoxidase subunit PaaE